MPISTENSPSGRIGSFPRHCWWIACLRESSIDNAIDIFAKARVPGIYKQDYLNDLVTRFGDESATRIPAPERPEWCQSKTRLADGWRFAHLIFILQRTVPMRTSPMNDRLVERWVDRRISSVHGITTLTNRINDSEKNLEYDLTPACRKESIVCPSLESQPTICCQSTGCYCRVCSSDDNCIATESSTHVRMESVRDRRHRENTIREWNILDAVFRVLSLSQWTERITRPSFNLPTWSAGKQMALGRISYLTLIPNIRTSNILSGTWCSSTKKTKSTCSIVITTSSKSVIFVSPKTPNVPVIYPIP